MPPDDPIRRQLLDRRYADTARRLDREPASSESLESLSTELLASILRQRGRLRARLESAVWRAAAAEDMARRTERFLNLRAQYASLSDDERRTLTALYARLVDELRAGLGAAEDDVGPALEAATGDHLRRLVSLLEAADQGDDLAATARGERVTVCAAYRPALQLAVLGVAPATLPEPVLDLGAGPDGALVAYLRDRGVDARGIDRLAEDGPHLVAADWLAWDAGRDRWGAILSHMAFSNHFLHHHRRGDDAAVRYAARWVELLAALRVGGRFHYAPALPFIEPLLAPDAFDVRRAPVPGLPARDGALSHATTITRLR